MVGQGLKPRDFRAEELSGARGDDRFQARAREILLPLFDHRLPFPGVSLSSIPSKISALIIQRADERFHGGDERGVAPFAQRGNRFEYGNGWFGSRRGHRRARAICWGNRWHSQETSPMAMTHQHTARSDQHTSIHSRSGDIRLCQNEVHVCLPRPETPDPPRRQWTATASARSNPFPAPPPKSRTTVAGALWVARQKTLHARAPVTKPVHDMSANKAGATRDQELRQLAHWCRIYVKRENREVLFIADDFGMNAEVNRAVVQAHSRGVLHGASLMVGQTGTADAVRAARNNPGLRVGWHLHLDNSQPVTCAAWPWGDSYRRAGWAIRLSRQARQLMREEVRAQRELFRGRG